MPEIIVATRNPGKLREIRQVLADLPVAVCGLDGFDPIEEPAETGDTFGQNAREKALYYAGATGQWSLADDSGLEVDALGGAPGVRSARYAARATDARGDRKTIDARNNAKLLAEVEGLGPEERTARFVCHLALARPGEVLLETEAAVEGRIIDTPRGDNGFGYDPVFFLADLGKTAAELSAQQKNAISHRGKAVRRFAAMLQAFLATRGD